VYICKYANGECTGRAYPSACVSHLVDGGVVDSCFDVTQRTWRLW